MKKVNIFSILFTLCWITAALLPLPVYAEPCTEQDVKESEQTLKDNAKKQMEANIAALDKYNQLAKTAINCIKQHGASYQWTKTNAKEGKPIVWSMQAVQAGNIADPGTASKLFDPAKYEYTGTKWKAGPVNSACVGAVEAAAAQQSILTQQSVQTSAYLGIVRGDQSVPKACICGEASEVSTNMECLTYASQDAQPAETKDGCKTFSEYMAGLAICPLCEVFEVILNTDSRVAHIAWEAAAKPLQKVVLIFFAVMLAIETLKAVSALAGSGITSYLKSIFTHGLKVAIAFYILGNASVIYGYFISPVIKGGLEMGEIFLQMGGAENAGACQLNAEEGNFAEVQGFELDSSLLSNILSAVRCFNNSSVIMPAVGRALICHGWANDGSFLPDLNMWFAGLITYVFGLAIWLAMAFYLIDCTVQLGMVCALMPLFVACWPFKMTQKYTMTGVKMIMNTFFVYVLMGVVMLVGLEIVGFSLSGGSPDSDMSTYISMLNQGDTDMDKLKKMVSLDGEAILILIACCIMAMKLVAQANGAAGKFSSGSGSSIGSKMGGAASSAMHRGAAAAGGAAVNVAKAGGSAFLNNTRAGRTLAQAGNRVASGVNKVATATNKFFLQTAPAKTASFLTGGKIDKYQNRAQGSGMPDDKSDNKDNDKENKDNNKPDNNTPPPPIDNV